MRNKETIYPFGKQLFLLLLLAIGLTASCIAAAAAKTNNDVITSIDLRNVTVANALQMISEQSGLNFVASQKASNKKISLFLHNVRPMDVLETIVKTYNLWYQQDSDSNTVRVYTIDEFRLGEIGSARDQVEIFTLKYPNATDVGYAIRDLYGNRVRMSLGGNMWTSYMELRQRFMRYQLLRQQSQLSKQTSGGNSNSSGMGGGSTGGGGMGGMFGMRSMGMGMGMNGGQNGRHQTGENQFIEKGLIENTINGEKLTENKAFSGMLSGSEEEGTKVLNRAMRQQSLIYVTVIQHQNRIVVRTRDPQTMKQIRNLVNRLDMALSTLMLEVKIYAANLSDSLDSVINLQSAAGQFAATLGPVQALTASQGGLVASFVNKQISDKLQLLQSQGRLTTLASPLLVTTNQEVSRVFVGDERPIVTGYTSSTTGTTGTAIATYPVQPIIVPQTELRTIGTSLVLTPNINADRSVSIRVLIEQSTLAGNPATIPVQVSNELIDATVDVVATKSFIGTVVSKDKMAIAIGGLIQESTNDQVSGIPLLMDIPWIGNLFKETHKARSREELIVVLRPYVQTTPTEAAGERIMQNNSMIPGSDDFDNDLDLYTQPERGQTDYRLKEDSKLYPYQDDLKQ